MTRHGAAHRSVGERPAASGSARTIVQIEPKPTGQVINPLIERVIDAIESLGSAFLRAPENDRLRTALGSADLSPNDFARQLVRVVYRVLFLTIAERVEMLHPPGAAADARDRYASVYSIRRLLAQEAAGETATDAWRRLCIVTESLARPGGDQELALPALRSFLWSSSSTPDLIGPGHDQPNAPVALGGDALIGVIRTLHAQGNQGIDPAQLGAIYESILELTPCVDLDAGTVALRPEAGNARRASGSFYTPDGLVQHLLDVALEPTIRDRLDVAGADARAREDALLGICVCDPAAGSGHFLIGAARRLAAHLAHVRASEGNPPNHEHALRDIIRRCVHGVDIDPMAAELCRINLWFAMGEPGASFSTLNDRVRVGDALLGTSPEFMAQGIPDAAFDPRPGEDPGSLARLRKRNRSERARASRASENVAAVSPERARLAADAWCAAFVWPTSDDAARAETDVRADAITESGFRDLLNDPQTVPPVTVAEIRRLAGEHRFFHWHLEFPEILGDTERAEPGFDVVIGNPPFLNQLESATAAARGPAAIVRATTAGAVRGYTDGAAAFVLLAARLCRPGGRYSLVQPLSFLAARDAGPIRSGILNDSALTHLWVGAERVFEGASILTCAPTLHRAGPRIGKLSRGSSGEFTPLPELRIDADELRREETWAPLAAAALGIPEFEFDAGGIVGDRAAATADFRDQYYGLDGFLFEDADVAPIVGKSDRSHPPIVTAGLIDLAACRWGHAPTRILKRAWDAPRIDRERMTTDGTLSDWIDARLVPKIILATQTRVLEVFVDEQGRFVPSLPLITIQPKSAGDLWRVAAAVASPVCTALALQRYSGTALSAQAIKLSAKQALTLPTPADDRTWGEASELLRDAQIASDERTRRRRLEAFAARSIASYRVPRDQAAELAAWWSGRLK